MSRHETPILLLVYLAVGVQRWKPSTVVYKDKGTYIATSYKPTWQWRIDQSQNAPFCLAAVTNAISSYIGPSLEESC